MLEFVKDEGKRAVLFLVLSGISLIVGFFKPEFLPFDASWVAILLCGLPIIKGAAIALITEFDVKADLLVSLALIASVLTGETFAAGEIAFIMTIGAMLEERTVQKARAGIEKLVHLTPRTARIVVNGEDNIVPAEDVQVGVILRVLAGETVAVDGTITQGQTSIDQSIMTGESLPVDKTIGDAVSSGTVNQFGTFEMRATSVGKNSSLQRMIRLVESADASKAKIVGLADRWATWIVVIALLSAIGTWFVTGEILRSVTILVVFCPCALVLATPTAIMAGIGNATRRGILVREGDALERLAGVFGVAFDKTGTLTHGKLSVQSVESFSEEYTNDKIMMLTASAERRSEHPLGQAIVKHYRDSTGSTPPEPQEFTMIAGRGVQARIDGKQLLAGNANYFSERNVELSSNMRKKASEYHEDGCTIVYVAVDGSAVGFVVLADELRSDAATVVQAIDRLGIKTILLTGDHKHAAEHIARQVGIDELRYDCLPETKLETIADYKKNGQLLCMIGDGVNDAPALKTAHVGIAMGGIGSDIAIDAADIVLVSDEIKELPHLFMLARKTMGTIRINLTLSMLLNFAAILLAMTGILNPVIGALVHNVGSVAVIINSAFLLRWRKADM